MKTKAMLIMLFIGMISFTGFGQINDLNKNPHIKLDPIKHRLAHANDVLILKKVFTLVSIDGFREARLYSFGSCQVMIVGKLQKAPPKFLKNKDPECVDPDKKSRGKLKDSIGI